MKTTKEQRDAWRAGRIEGRQNASPNNTNQFFLPPTFVEAVLVELDEALARISELEDTIDLTEAEDLIASSYGRNTDACAVADEIHARRGANWTGALTSRELAKSSRPAEPSKPGGGEP